MFVASSIRVNAPFGAVRNGRDYSLLDQTAVFQALFVGQHRLLQQTDRVAGLSQLPASEQQVRQGKGRHGEGRHPKFGGRPLRFGQVLGPFLPSRNSDRVYDFK